MIILYFFLLSLLSVYSFSLVDPNLTLFNNSVWAYFREIMVYFGYYRRDLSSIAYILLILLLFFLSSRIALRPKIKDLMKLTVLIGLITVFSYPFLSHDFFNYLFDAKILTFYGKNPYAFKALDFPYDPWIRFMHWTHRTYPYGPSFLIISIAPSFLAAGKFILNYFFFKLTFVLFYFLSVFYLNKINHRVAIFFAFNPFVILEGLINNHNDLIAISLAFIGIYLFLHQNKTALGKIMLLISGGIKYLTLPLVFLSANKKKFNNIVLLSLIFAIIYYSFQVEIQPWYFLNLLIILPFFPKLVSQFNIFFAGLMLSYYPYIRFGQWTSPNNVSIKHWIITIFLGINLFVILFKSKKLHAKKNARLFQ